MGTGIRAALLDENLREGLKEVAKLRTLVRALHKEA
jgi:hypothetical protein